MMSAASLPAEPTRQRAPSKLWWLLPVVLLGGLMSLQLVMVSVAVNDVGFAVEEDYYAKAVNWEQHQAQAQLNAQLGWQVALATEARAGGTGLELAVSESAVGQAGNAEPISGAQVRVEAFANAHAAERVRVKLTEQSPGRYLGYLPTTRPGLWELRFEVDHVAGRFTNVQRRDLQ